mgnify:CR=1 FL=1
MTWLAPEAFGWAALAALLILFYLLRPRRRRITVSSLFLWRRDPGDATGSTFWQIVRRWLLPALQLLALATLVAALARPAWPARESARADLVLVIDEACQNIIRHAYKGSTEGEITLEIRRDDDDLIVLLRDFADTVDVTKIKPRDLEDIRPGGLGTHLIREIMDEVEITPLPGNSGNLMRMSKKLE